MFTPHAPPPNRDILPVVFHCPPACPAFFAPSHRQKLQQSKNAGARPLSGPPDVYQSILASAPSVSSISQRRRRSHLRGRIHPAVHLHTSPSVNIGGGRFPPALHLIRLSAYLSKFISCSSTFPSFSAAFLPLLPLFVLFLFSSLCFLFVLRPHLQNFKTLQNFKRQKKPISTNSLGSSWRLAPPHPHPHLRGSRPRSPTSRSGRWRPAAAWCRAPCRSCRTPPRSRTSWGRRS